MPKMNQDFKNGWYCMVHFDNMSLDTFFVIFIEQLESHGEIAMLPSRSSFKQEAFQVLNCSS